MFFSLVFLVRNNIQFDSLNAKRINKLNGILTFLRNRFFLLYLCKCNIFLDSLINKNHVLVLKLFR